MKRLQPVLFAALSLLLVACPSQTKVSADEGATEKSGAAAEKAPEKAAPAANTVTPPATPAVDPAAPAPGDLPAPADVAAPPADAETTASGLASKVIQKGTGTVHPAATDIVKVHYTGWQTTGKMFDSSVKRGQPTSFPLNRVIPGWTEGVQLMVAGEKRRFWIPEKLAYAGRPGPPAGMLVFDVELIAITTPKVPEDVAAPPASAKKTQSGLASKVLNQGTGSVHPTKDSVVQVDYSGWTTDGKMFDSSVTRGRPATFPLSGVIAGWTEGVQLMVEGESRRFWIPENLAYQGKPGAPAGMLVFDVTLIKILK